MTGISPDTIVYLDADAVRHKRSLGYGAAIRGLLACAREHCTGFYSVRVNWLLRFVNSYNVICDFETYRKDEWEEIGNAGD